MTEYLRFAKYCRPSTACGLLFALIASGISLKAADVAVIVHPDVPAANLSLSEVRKILLGDRQFWNSDLRVTILMRAPVAKERDVVLKTIYQMSEAQFRQYWVAKVFRAEIAAGPKIVYTNDMAADLVAAIPGSIGFVDAAQTPRGVKIIRINGALPGDKSYPLH